MGQLDEPRFEAIVQRGCPACGGTTLEIRTYIDRRLLVMLGDPNDDGKWAHDGEKFVDGAYRITCPACAHVVFTSEDCPRCHAAGALGRTLEAPSRLVVPKRCTKCNETEMIALALVPASARYSVGTTPTPKPLVDFGDPGYHLVAYGCESCDAAVVASGCPLCDAPGPLRPRP